MGGGSSTPSRPVHTLDPQCRMGPIRGVEEVKETTSGNKEKDEKYDVEIEIDSLRQLDREGWKVHVHNMPNKELFTWKKELDDPKRPQEQHMFVGVLGLYNRGKTFVLNRLAKTSLPMGWNTHTKGISLKSPRSETKYMLVDIAGFGTPCKILNNKSVHEQFQKERFILEMVVRMCHMFIVVVNDITLEDQVFIENLRETVKRFNRSSDSRFGKKCEDIIILHNYIKIETLDGMNQAYADQVVNHYSKGGKWMTQTLTVGTHKQEFKYWYSEGNERRCGLRHVGILREPSEGNVSPRDADGVKHNHTMFDLISCWLQSATEMRRHNPFEEFKVMANDILQMFLDNPQKLEVFEWEETGMKYLAFGFVDPSPPPTPSSTASSALSLLSPTKKKSATSDLEKEEEECEVTSEEEDDKNAKGPRSVLAFREDAFVPKYFIPPPSAYCAVRPKLIYDVVTTEKHVWLFIEVPGCLQKGEESKYADLREEAMFSFKFFPDTQILNLFFTREQCPQYKKGNTTVREHASQRSFGRLEERIMMRELLPQSPALDIKAELPVVGGMKVLQFFKKQAVDAAAAEPDFG